MNKILISDHPHIVVLDSARELFSPLVVAFLNKGHIIHACQNAKACMAYLNTELPTDLLLIDGALLANGANLELQDFINKIRVPVAIGMAIDDNWEQDRLSFNVLDYIISPYLIPIELFRIENHILQHRSLQIISEQNHYLINKITEHAQKLVNAGFEAQHIEKLEKEILVLLSRLADYRDPETANHLQRMSHYAKLIAKKLGLSSEQQKLIQQAAPLHDIGKLTIPDEILFKPGKLDAVEMEEMKQHAQMGYDLLKDSTSPLILVAADIALSHHEKFDGSGYPKGLEGESIPLLSRIVAVADVFDALTSKRPYKAAWSLEDAADYLRSESGKHFDPCCVTAFLDAWPQVLAIYSLYNDEE